MSDLIDIEQLEKSYRPHSQNRVNIIHCADMEGMKTNFAHVWEFANTVIKILMVM